MLAFARILSTAAGPFGRGTWSGSDACATNGSRLSMGLDHFAVAAAGSTGTLAVATSSASAAICAGLCSSGCGDTR
jgi:hypothetical protein